MKQYQGETLKVYINRFGAQVVKVGTAEKPMIVYAFRKGVCPRPFCESIIRNRPKTFVAIRRRAVEHIASEGEVYEKRTSVAPTRPRMQTRAQPAGSSRPRREGRTRRGDAPTRQEGPYPGVEQRELGQRGKGIDR